MVEVTGLEPAASCSQSRHSSQNELHLDICKAPKSVTEIGTQTFDGCSNLSDIILPAGIKKIENDSFEKCKKLTIHAPADSYAEAYAKKSKIAFVAE